jgi:hypothetical protein
MENKFVIQPSPARERFTALGEEEKEEENAEKRVYRQA